MSTYIIGDVHGCFNTLQRLLDKIKFNPTQDTVWFTGDLINRGPDSFKTLEFISQTPNMHTVLGNHDLTILAIYYANLNAKQNCPDLFSAPKSDTAVLFDWLKKQPLCYYNKKDNWILTHAGILPSWSLDDTQRYAKEVETVLQSNEQDANAFLAQLHGNEPNAWDDSLTGVSRWRFIVNALARMRLCDDQNHLILSSTDYKTAPPNTAAWFNIDNPHIPDNTRIFFGHWASLKGLTHSPQHIALDTGCVWGGSLTAYCIETQNKVQVSNA